MARSSETWYKLLQIRSQLAVLMDEVEQSMGGDAEEATRSDGPTEEDMAVEGLTHAVDMVSAFHRQKRVSPVQRLTELGPAMGETMDFAAACLSTCAEQLLEVAHEGDGRLMRAHLMCEELSELLVAMGNRDEVETLDAMADLLYVLLGTAYALDLPLPAAFAEVHRSNMTKSSGDRIGDRGKGGEFSPPDLASVLMMHRDPPKSVVVERVNPCSGLRELIREEVPDLGAGGPPNRHSPHLMGRPHGSEECVNCGMTEYDIVAQVAELGRPKCTGVRRT
jgi:hypothetical protein